MQCQYDQYVRDRYLVVYEQYRCITGRDEFRDSQRLQEERLNITCTPPQNLSASRRARHKYLTCMSLSDDTHQAKRQKIEQDTPMTDSISSRPTVDPAIFQKLQESIDRDAAFKDEIRDVTKELDSIYRQITVVLSQCHSASSKDLQHILETSRPHFQAQQSKISDLANISSKMPYYKFNGMYSSQVQNASFSAVFAHWLGLNLLGSGTLAPGNLLTIEEVATVLGAKVNVGDEDVFHLTTEEYLHSLISLINEMSRLAVNSVTIGEHQRPLLISKFVKDLFAAFQILNLKNDNLRRRYDSIKYDVKKVEEVVYDLSLRGLTSDPDNAGLPAKPVVADSYLKVKALTETAKMPSRGSAHAAGYDMYASEATTIAPQGRALVSTGLSIAVPADCYARVAPRSGLAVKNGIQTGAGVVDSDYRGEVRVLLFNQSTTEFVVNVGDRIAQLVLERVYTPEVQQTDNLEESIRGAGGFGSTGN